MSAPMEAGRELDALVAERIMGEAYPAPITEYPWWKSAPVVSPKGQWVASSAGGDAHIWLPRRYSTDIAAAWTVVERMAVLGFTIDIEWKGADRVYAHTAEVSLRRDLYTQGHAVADTAPLAICLAALKGISDTPLGSPPDSGTLPDENTLNPGGSSLRGPK